MNSRNKILVGAGVGLLILSAFMFVLGGVLQGWDIIAFFQSSLFIWYCVIVGLFIISVGIVLIYDKVNRL